jgi:hypothetical protein
VYQNRFVWTAYPAGLKVPVSYSAKGIRLGGNIAIAFVPANTWHSGVGGVHTSRGGDGGESGGALKAASGAQMVIGGGWWRRGMGGKGAALAYTPGSAGGGGLVAIAG